MIRSAIPTMIAAAAVLAACQAEKKVYQPAPLRGGEVLNYITIGAGTTRFTVTFEKTDGGFIISSGRGFEAVKVGPDLMPGRKTIDIYDIAVIWLPPSLRQIGAKLHLGTVTEMPKINGRPAFLLNTRNGQEKRYYDAATGFLIKARTQGSHGGESFQLVGTTIPNLKVGR